jgi:hypothetical protein
MWAPGGAAGKLALALVSGDKHLLDLAVRIPVFAPAGLAQPLAGLM